MGGTMWGVWCEVGVVCTVSHGAREGAQDTRAELIEVEGRARGLGRGETGGRAREGCLRNRRPIKNGPTFCDIVAFMFHEQTRSLPNTTQKWWFLRARTQIAQKLPKNPENCPFFLLTGGPGGL